MDKLGLPILPHLHRQISSRIAHYSEKTSSLHLQQTRQSLNSGDSKTGKYIEMIRENGKLPDDILRRIPKLVDSLAGDKDVVALYSFGSLAQNALKPLSDLDFGILLSYQMSKKDSFDKHLKLVGLFTESLQTEEIDLVFMNHAPSNIAFQIVKTGKLLLCNDRRALIDFREQVVMSYLDFKFVRDAFDSAFLKGVGYHG